MKGERMLPFRDMGTSTGMTYRPGYEFAEIEIRNAKLDQMS